MFLSLDNPSNKLLIQDKYHFRFRPNIPFNLKKNKEKLSCYDTLSKCKCYMISIFNSNMTRIPMIIKVI